MPQLRFSNSRNIFRIVASLTEHPNKIISSSSFPFGHIYRVYLLQSFAHSLIKNIAAMADEETKIILKLLIDGKSQKVLFAEAGKDFVDFIFSLLTLPLGSIIKLLCSRNMVGSIGKLYQSVEKLNETYLVANRDKSSLLQPNIASFNGVSPLLLDTDAMAEIQYYLCGKCCKNVTTARNIHCPTCRVVMTTEVNLMMPSISASSFAADSLSGGDNGGFVKGVITYMITDDLEVTPLSSISSIMLINRFSMKKDAQLEEKYVAVGMKEGLALLEASLESSTVLTDVFLSSRKKSEAPADPLA